MAEERSIVEDRHGNIGVPIGFEPITAWFKVVGGKALLLGLTTTAEKPDGIHLIHGRIVRSAGTKALRYWFQKQKEVSGEQLRLLL